MVEKMRKIEKINGHYVDVIGDENKPLKERLKEETLLIRDNIERLAKQLDELIKLLD